MASRSYALGLHRGAHRRLMWIGGLVLGAAAIGTAVYFYEKGKVASQQGTYWAGLTSAQQAQYKQGLWTWLSAGNSDPGTQTSQITSVSSLDDPDNLSLATTAFQVQYNIAHPGANLGAAGQGVVDDATFAAVTA